jgi:hypothetical protein
MTTTPAELIGQTLDKWALRSGATDKQFYDKGIWHVDDSPTANPPYSQSGPLLAAAAIGRGDMARETFDASMKTWQRSDGAFTRLNGIDGIDTMMFASQAGLALLLFNGADSGDAIRVSQHMAMADYLINARHVYYWSNGNINLGYAVVMAEAWRLAESATAKKRYADAYHSLVVMLMGHYHYGYFDETGPGGTGFDPEYTQVQGDQLVRLWLVTGDPWWRGILIQLVAKLRTRVSLPSYMLDTSGGTRHIEQGRSVAFSTPALGILGEKDAPAQWEVAAQTIRNAWSYSNVVLYSDLGGRIGTLVVNHLLKCGGFTQVRP